MTHCFKPTCTPLVVALLMATGFAGNLASAGPVIESYRNVAPPLDVHVLPLRTPVPHDPSLAGGPDLLAASSTDLVQGRTPQIAYAVDSVRTWPVPSTRSEEAAGEATWTDGSLVTFYRGGPISFLDDADIHAPYGTVHGWIGLDDIEIETFVTFDLGAIYDLTQVDLFLGWNDSGRDDSSFEVSASLDDAAYTPLATHLRGPNDTNSNDLPVTNLFRVVDDGVAGSQIARARYVQLHFWNADNYYAGLVEVDVHGALATPEPTAALIAAVLCLAWAGYRKCL